MSGSLENCRRKVRCENSYAAMAAAWRMQMKNPFAKINAYPCKYCSGWHIGNAYNRRDAKKSLNRLARMMFHPSFYTKVPFDIQRQLVARRARMEGFLAHRRDGDDDPVAVPQIDDGLEAAAKKSFRRWEIRRLVALPPQVTPVLEFVASSILSP